MIAIPITIVGRIVIAKKKTHSNYNACDRDGSESTQTSFEKGDGEHGVNRRGDGTRNASNRNSENNRKEIYIKVIGKTNREYNVN